MVSILVPVYNADKTIRRCLDSILAQTYQELEVVLVNDGSQDASMSVLQDYANKDRRVAVINQENKGVAAARNTALRHATGNYILYVDADDWIESNMLERMLALAADHTDIVFCASDHAESKDEVLRVSENAEYEVWDHDRQLLEFLKHQRMNGMLWNKLLKTSLTEGCFFDEKTGYGEDAQFLWKVLQHSEKMILTNEILYHHVLDSNSISHLSFSSKKYSAIPMWEEINAEVAEKYPQMTTPARNSLMCAAVYSMFEARQCGYHNQEQISHMRAIARKNIGGFLGAKHISIKFKLYALAVCVGY